MLRRLDLAWSARRTAGSLRTRRADLAIVATMSAAAKPRPAAAFTTLLPRTTIPTRAASSRRARWCGERDEILLSRNFSGERENPAVAGSPAGRTLVALASVRAGGTISPSMQAAETVNAIVAACGTHRVRIARRSLAAVATVLAVENYAEWATQALVRNQRYPSSIVAGSTLLQRGGWSLLAVLGSEGDDSAVADNDVRCFEAERIAVRHDPAAVQHRERVHCQRRRSIRTDLANDERRAIQREGITTSKLLHSTGRIRRTDWLPHGSGQRLKENLLPEESNRARRIAGLQLRGHWRLRCLRFRQAIAPQRRH